MQISFKDERLQKECNDRVLLQKRYGRTRAKRLMQRIEELTFAESLETLRSAPGRCRELHGKAAGYLSMDLDHACHLVFRPSANQPRKPDGGLDWEHVRAVDITAVEPR